MSIDAKKVEELQAFVEMIAAQPALLHIPQLEFFKSYLEKMGARIPYPAGGPPPSTGCCGGHGSGAHAHKQDGSGSGGAPKIPKKAEEVVSDEEMEEADIPDPVSDGEEDLDRLSVESEPVPAAPPLGEMEVELSDEQLDKQGALKSGAQEALEDGDLKKAVDLMTEAMEIGNCSAMMLTKRAELLLKAKRPAGAIADCDRALNLNPDSAKAYKIRGMCYRKLHNWEKAHADLEVAQRLDFDDAMEDAQKIVAKKWKEIEKVRVAQRLQRERRAQKEKERMIKKRKAEIKKAQEVQKQRDEEEKKRESRKPRGGPGGMPGGFPGGMPGGMGGMPGGMPGGMGGMAGMPGMAELFQDPELLGAMSNPKVMQAMQELMSNPSSIGKYKDDPEIMKVMSSIMGKFGGAGGMPDMEGMMGGMGGMPGGFPGMPGAPAASSQDYSNVEECD